jgi:hypothetical protein
VTKEQTIDVDGLRFQFDDTWRALKWDEHDAYRRGLSSRHGTKAIDIVALRHHDELWLIEGNSIRSEADRIRFKNKRAAKREPLHEEFVGKIRDTMAAAVWAQGRHRAATELVPYLRAGARGSHGRIHAVLWCEGLEEPELVPLEDQVRKSLHWLNPKVEILNNDICQRHPRRQIGGVTVSNVP